MKQLKNKTVLITGGASGIGKIMARMMLERQAKVIIWDISALKIAETIADLSPKGNICGFCLDVSDIEQIYKTSELVKEQVGVVDVLINNAGIIVGKYFHEHTMQDITQTMDVNANAPMYVTKVFLSDMLEQNSGHICNIASSAGVISNPKMSVYAASKWSVIGWSDSLRLEMKQLKKNITITTIMPYYINTGMFEGVKSKIPILEPEYAASAIVKAIEKDFKLLCIPQYLYRLTRFGQAVFSIRTFDWLANNKFGIYKTMEHFTGRKN